MSSGPGMMLDWKRTRTGTEALNRVELATAIKERLPELPLVDITISVAEILEALTQTLASGNRVEIRGFGSFGLRYRKPRIGRNPKTGETVSVSSKYLPYFRAGKVLAERVK